MKGTTQMVVMTEQQIRKAEQAGTQQGLSYVRMMENAGSAAARFIEQHWQLNADRTVVFLCGAGNNGGDGFVAARRLAQKGVSVSVVLACGKPASLTAIEMWQRLSALSITIVDAKEQISFARQLIHESDLVVDCVFGIGFHGQLPPLVQELFLFARQLKKPVAAMDLPSGCHADSGAVADGTPVCSGTVTFHAYKYAHILYPAREYCGFVQGADIGLPKDAEEAPFIVDKSQVAAVLVRPNGDTHKGTFGTASLLVGSEGMAGAALFAVQACLRCGVGLAKPVIPHSIYSLVASAAPEGVYTLYDSKENPGEIATLCGKGTACLAGCGLRVNTFTKAACRELALSCKIPLVLDADGINSLLGHIDVLKKREGATVLTPHPGEMARLLNVDTGFVQEHRFETAQRFAKEYGVVLVLKGAGTIIAAPDGRTAVSLTGNSGLSKGGSGDMLAGMIVSFLAQGIQPFEAACTGVWLHGLAGERAALALSKRSVLPRDVIETLPSLFLEFEE